ncbi:MAG: glutathione S-transferase family protein [Myxococcota bacterium]
MKNRGLEKIHTIPPMVTAVAKSRDELGAHLDRLEVQLSKRTGPWILGENFSLADVSWLVTFERLRQANVEAVFFSTPETTPVALGALRPECAAYWERLKGRPAYAEAILGHSHPLVDDGREQIQEKKARNEALRKMLEG